MARRSFSRAASFDADEPRARTRFCDLVLPGHTSEQPERPLSAEQEAAVARLEAGESLFLTGVAGTGKTYTLNTWLSRTKKKVAVTASTGIAATHLNGQTVHRWSGAGIGDKTPEQIASKTWWSDQIAPGIKGVDALVIDEVSMIDGVTFAVVNSLCQIARGSPAPFGGMQVVVVGDMGQLAPVEHAAKGFAFETDEWWDAKIATVELLQVHRQSDAAFAAILRSIRDGTLTPEGAKALTSRVRAYDPDVVEAVRLSTHNARVDAANEARLARLPGRPVLYAAKESGLADCLQWIDKNCITPRLLALKVGARVMFTKNHQFGLYVNGTLGRVAAVTKDDVSVLIDGAEEPVSVARVEWTAKRFEKGREVTLATRRQYPLRLAWAITVHKSQGSTLDLVSVDLESTFAEGQAYAALSRARSLEGLNIERWRGARSIFTSKLVQDFNAGRYALPKGEGGETARDFILRQQQSGNIRS
jgi:ATP-dependent exoDNAse (exonuclease V) alpha subunit